MLTCDWLPACLSVSGHTALLTRREGLCKGNGSVSHSGNCCLCHEPGPQASHNMNISISGLYEYFIDILYLDALLPGLGVVSLMFLILIVEAVSVSSSSPVILGRGHGGRVLDWRLLVTSA